MSLYNRRVAAVEVGFTSPHVNVYMFEKKGKGTSMAYCSGVVQMLPTEFSHHRVTCHVTFIYQLIIITIYVLYKQTNSNCRESCKWSFFHLCSNFEMIYFLHKLKKKYFQLQEYNLRY